MINKITHLLWFLKIIMIEIGIRLVELNQGLFITINYLSAMAMAITIKIRSKRLYYQNKYLNKSIKTFSL